VGSGKGGGKLPAPEENLLEEGLQFSQKERQVWNEETTRKGACESTLLIHVGKSCGKELVMTRPSG